MVLFWGAVIWLIVYLVNQNKHLEDLRESQTPMEILKERYVNGEITKKEYDKTKKDL